MCIRDSKDKNKRRDYRVRNTYLRLKPLGLLGITFIHSLKEFLAVLYIFRVCVYLIHQPIFFAMLFGCPVGNLFHKRGNILRVGGRLLHKIVLDLFHAVCGLSLIHIFVTFDVKTGALKRLNVCGKRVSVNVYVFFGKTAYNVGGAGKMLLVRVLPKVFQYV